MRALLIAAGIVISFIAIAHAQVWIMGPNGHAFGSGSHAPPPTCNGTIDLSTGCAQPMLGGA